jgi:PAS domain S-box-containing protein
MNLSLKTKVLLFIAAVVLMVSSVSTFLFITAHKRSVEREVVARGIALTEALTRAVDEGLAAEDLNLIKDVEDIVHTKDVVLAQVYSTLWLAVAAVPTNLLNVPPSSAALEHFKRNRIDHDYFYNNDGPWIDIYKGVYLNTRDARIPPLLIGYVRLRISTDPIAQSIQSAIITNIFVSALLALIAVGVLNAIVRKFVLIPILNLHSSISKHKEGEFPDTVPVQRNDEIGELSAEFNAMSRSLREREERLAEEKERLAVTLRSIGDGVIVTDVNGTITLINKVAEHHTGWTARESVGRQLPDVLTIINEKTREQYENPVERVIRTGIIFHLSNQSILVRKDGAEIVIEDSAAPIRDRESRIVGAVLVFRDATEKRKMEEERLTTDKLQSVGLLAGGLAHDFNNLLTSIVGNISMAKMCIDPRSKAYDRLSDAEAASRRATDLTYQLLTFSKGGTPIKQTTSIVDTVKEAARFSLSGTKVAPVFDIAENIRDVDIDAGQMSQVFNNLIINAVQAMPEGGTIRFSIRNIVLAEQAVSTLPEGAYVKISVQDTGLGIRAEVLPNIFDPYFSTKQKGSGLGLATAYSVVLRHDGHIAVESRSGQGTTFHIYLPASYNQSAMHASGSGSIAEGLGTILVMDDERIIRDLASEMLTTLGYSVDVAAEGKEALEKYQEALAAGKPFSAVIMDLTIPGGMGGKDAIQLLLALDPNAKAIVSSGYSNDPIMADFEQYGFKSMITKPYNIESFSRILFEVVMGKSKVSLPS